MENTSEHTPDISVIVPIYNVEDYIEACIESICTQGVSAEIILVDDCGKDNSVDKATSYIKQLETTQDIAWALVTHQHNRGLSAARNSGVQASRGRYLFFLDSDDYLLPNALPTLLNAAERYQTDITVGQIETSTGEVMCHRLSDQVALEGKEASESYWARLWYPMAWNKLIRRHFYLENKLDFVEGILHEDEVWSAKCALCQPRIIGINLQTYYYRLLRPDAITTISRQSGERFGCALMTVLWSCTELGVEYRAMHNRPFREFLEDWLLHILFVCPRKLEGGLFCRLKYFNHLVQSYHSSSATPYQGKRDWHFSVIDFLCKKCPKFLAPLGIELFVHIWRIRPGQRVANILKAASK